MQHDSVIWKVISPGSGGFCSFRRTMPNNPTKFCKNAYNVLGLCHPLACPLANSRYATIREHKGECYLLIKTIERAHSPAKHWEKIKLSKDYLTALKQIDEYLMWWPKWRIHKCKLRLTKMHQFLIRARKLSLTVQPKLLRIWKPYERQQVKRERKAEIAAKITNVIKSELLERLHEGVYEGIYNFPMKQYNQILDENGKQDEMESESDDDEINKNKNKTKNKTKTKVNKQENKSKQSIIKSKEKIDTNAIENPFVGDYDGSDFEFEESDEYSDIEDFDVNDNEESEDEKEIEMEYEMENEYEQLPQNLNELKQITGQSIKSLNVSNKNKNNNNNNGKNKNKNKANNNNNEVNRDNNSINDNSDFIRNNARKGWNKGWGGQNKSVLGKRGSRNGNNMSNSNSNSSNQSSSKPPPKKRQKKIKIGYD